MAVPTLSMIRLYDPDSCTDNPTTLKRPDLVQGVGASEPEARIPDAQSTNPGCRECEIRPEPEPVPVPAGNAEFTANAP